MQDKNFNSNKDYSLLVNHNINHLIDNNPIVNDYKRKAKILHKKLKEEHLSNKDALISLRQCQDLVAQQHGYKHWHEFHTNIKKLYLDKKETNFLKYDINSRIPQFESKKNPINIGYNSQLSLSAWIDQDKLLEHVFIDGEDSFRNKIELHLIKQMIEQKKHIIYMDGQNNLTHVHSIIEHAKQSGREKDLRILSFLNDSQKDNSLEKYYWYLPQSLPFSNGGLTELIVSLMPDDEHIMWKGRAISLIASVMMVLTYMRDQKEILLDVDAIREYLILETIIKLYKTRRDFPNHIRAALRAYLISLPGFQESASKQNDTVLEQHGYLQMQFTEILCSLNAYAFSFKNKATIEDSQNTLDELYGDNEKLIFIIQFPEISTNPYAYTLSYFMNGIIANLAFKNLSESILTKNTLLNQQSIKYLFVNNCPLPNRFAVMPTQFKQLNISLILSYKTTEDKNCIMTKNNDIFKSLSYSMKTKIKENSDRPIEFNNKTSYKLISEDIHEDLIL